MTFDELVALAKALPDVVEGRSWGTPGIKRKQRFMLRLREDGETIVVKLDWPSCDRLLAERPETYFTEPHYLGYPSVLVNLATLSSDEAEDLLKLAWADAPKPARTRS